MDLSVYCCVCKHVRLQRVLMKLSSRHGVQNREANDVCLLLLCSQATNFSYLLIFIYLCAQHCWPLCLCLHIRCTTQRRLGWLVALLHCCLHFGNNLEFIALKGIRIVSVQFSAPEETQRSQHRRD